MENAKDRIVEEQILSKSNTAESVIILEALALLREVKRYRGFFYKQQVAKLEAKARELNIG